MIKKPLRVTAMLAMLATGTFSYAQDDAEPASEPGTLPTQTEPQQDMTFTVPVLKQLWEAQAVLNTTRDTVAHFSNDEEIVFVQSSAGTITALNAESGRRMWAAQVGRSDEVAMRATTDSQFVAVVVGSVLHTFDKFSGEKLFSYRLPESPSGPPLITRRETLKNNSVRIDRRIFVPLADRTVVAYDIETLTYFGQHGVLKKGVPTALAWKYGSGENTRFAPVAGTDRLVISSDSGNLHILNMTQPDEGRNRFQFLMNSATTAPLTVVAREDREFLLAACSNNRLFCIHLSVFGAVPGNSASEGDLKWTIPLSRTVVQPMVVVGDDVFVLSSEGVLRKFSLETGNPAQVHRGSIAAVTRTEGVEGKVPVYGAAVVARVQGTLAVNPISVANESTGQIVSAVTFDLGRCASQLSFAADETGNPRVSIDPESALTTGFRKAQLNEDRRILTLEFSDFLPGEVVRVLPEFEHPELSDIEVTDAHLAGGVIRAQVSPIRRSVLASVNAEGRIEPLSPRTITGNWKDDSDVWSVRDVQTLAAVSRNSVHFVDGSGQVVSVTRDNADHPVIFPIRDYTLQIANELTDRIFVSTTSGRVACLTETRFRMGLLPLPLSGGLTWLLYPELELAPDFAQPYQNPDRRPIMPEVPKTDPAPPAAQDSEQ